MIPPDARSCVECVLEQFEGPSDPSLVRGAPRAFNLAADVSCPSQVALCVVHGLVAAQGFLAHDRPVYTQTAGSGPARSAVIEHAAVARGVPQDASRGRQRLAALIERARGDGGPLSRQPWATGEGSGMGRGRCPTASAGAPRTPLSRATQRLRVRNALRRLGPSWAAARPSEAPRRSHVRPHAWVQAPPSDASLVAARATPRRSRSSPARSGLVPGLEATGREAGRGADSSAAMR